jgi:hypothetical protein
MEDDLNFVQDNLGSWILVCNIVSNQQDEKWKTACFFLNGRRPQLSWKMEDNINFIEMKDDLNFILNLLNLLNLFNLLNLLNFLNMFYLLNLFNLLNEYFLKLIWFFLTKGPMLVRGGGGRWKSG